jgi:hypothetical protein
MGKVCGCGNSVTSPLDELHCVKCAGRCCPSCAFAFESATYCGRCADSLLDAEGVPLRVSAPRPRSAKSETDDDGDKTPWVILVARDQPDLFSHLVRAFARDDKVEVIMDRRKNYSRNPPGMEDRLRTHGASVIKRRPS